MTMRVVTASYITAQEYIVIPTSERGEHPKRKPRTLDRPEQTDLIY